MRCISLLILLLFTPLSLAESKDTLSLEQNRQAAWFAQDRAYQQLADKVVQDLGSGLRWQQNAPNKQFSWAAAKRYCAKLKLANIANWRLPSRLELLSLLNFDQPDHAYDSNLFDAEPTDAFWSGTVYDNMPSHVWIAQFGEGDMYCLMRVAQAHVRCVA